MADQENKDEKVVSFAPTRRKFRRKQDDEGSSVVSLGTVRQVRELQQSDALSSLPSRATFDSLSSMSPSLLEAMSGIVSGGLPSGLADLMKTALSSRVLDFCTLSGEELAFVQKVVSYLNSLGPRDEGNIQLRKQTFLSRGSLENPEFQVQLLGILRSATEAKMKPHPSFYLAVAELLLGVSDTSTTSPDFDAGTIV